MSLRSFGWSEFWFLVESTQWTLILTLQAILIGGAIGFVIALARVSSNPLARFVAMIYVQIIQGIPVLVLVFLAYYGTRFAGFRLPPLVSAGVAMSIYASAYFGEIWRGCIQSVPRQQWEASLSLAMKPYQQYVHVILPQAFRISLPQTVGFIVQIIKNTSVAALIGFVELTRAGQLVNNATFQPIRVFLVVAALYFCICYPVSRFSRWLEGRTHAASRNR